MEERSKPAVRERAQRLQRVALRIIGIFGILGAINPPPARAQLGPDTARVATLVGRVSVERGGELWTVTAGQTLQAGQVVVTGQDGYAQFDLPDGSVLEVFPNSRLVFRANRFSWRDLLDLYLGKVRLQIQRLTQDDPPLRVTSPTAVISVRGTIFEVEVDATQETVVAVQTGSVSVRHRLLPGQEVVVQSGQSLRVIPNVPLTVAKMVVPLGVLGRVVRIVGETLAQVNASRGSGSASGSSPGSGAGSAPGASPGPSSGPSASDAGSNEPAPPPGQDNTTSAPPGDVIP